jgi:hypothetical protein
VRACPGRYFFNSDLFDEMYASLADRSTRKLLNRLARLDVLLIDELGYLNLKPEQSNIFFKLMEERYHPPLVSMATPLSGPLSDAGGCLISPRLARAAVFGQPRQNFHSDSKKSFGVSPSQSASRLRSFHSHRVRTESETQPTFTARLSVKPAPP